MTNLKTSSVEGDVCHPFDCTIVQYVRNQEQSSYLFNSWGLKQVDRWVDVRFFWSFHRIRIKILSSITNLQNREGLRKAVDDLFAAFCMFYTPDHRLCYCIPNKNMLHFQNFRYNLFKSVLPKKPDHIIIQSKCITINDLLLL